MIGIVDYEAGNITSVRNALRATGAEFTVSAEELVLRQCTGIILPGVGAASGAIRSLEQRKLLEFLRKLDVPFLGICLGMQLLYDESEEGETRCLGIVPGKVRKLDDRAARVPHMGWNQVRFTAKNLLNTAVRRRDYFYFAHSYYAPFNTWTSGLADCGISFAAAVQKGNYFGVQFHPEKSGAAGLRLLKAFAELCKSFPQ